MRVWFTSTGITHLLENVPPPGPYHGTVPLVRGTPVTPDTCKAWWQMHTNAAISARDDWHFAIRLRRVEESSGGEGSEWVGNSVGNSDALMTSGVW